MSKTEIEQIAGKYLGRTMSGELMTPYEAPDSHDPTLLVPIPREIGRRAAGIVIPLKGNDVWHAYEFSYLKPSGQPQTGILKFKIDCNTEVMIESKSFKLYLNSFDFERFDSIGSVLSTIREDLSGILKGAFSVSYHEGVPFIQVDSWEQKWENASIDNEEITNIIFDEDPGILKTLQPSSEIVRFHTANLRSACEITNQKDTGHCFISMKGAHVFDRDELARYIFSLRDAQHFHENVTEIIYNELYKRYSPDELLVVNIYNRRGGLDIHPARYTSEEFYSAEFPMHDDVESYIIMTNQV